MKHVLLFSMFLFFAASVNAQSANAVFFSEFGETFTLFINGQAQNDEPAANVRVEDLTMDFAQVRVQFADMPAESFQGNAGFERGQESTYIIKKNRKGNYVLRLHSFAPIAGGAASEVVETPAPPTPPAVQPKTETSVVGGETTTTTISTTTTTAKPNKAGVQMQVPGGTVTIDMDVPDMDVEVTETTTITTTTTSTSTGSTGGAPMQETTGSQIVTDGPCANPASSSDIDRMKKSISSKSFEEAKMTTAKQATKGKCLKAEQVVEIMSLFTFEDSKLEFAKFAYDYTLDVDNYYLVNDAFTFSSSIDELNEYLEGR